MKRHKNLLVSFVVSLVVHGVAVMCLVVCLVSGSSPLVPVFRHGISSVAIGFLDEDKPPAEVPRNTDYAQPAKPQIRVETKPPVEKPEKPVEKKQPPVQPVVERQLPAKPPEPVIVKEMPERLSVPQSVIEDPVAEEEPYMDGKNSAGADEGKIKSADRGVQDETTAKQTDKPSGGNDQEKGVQEFAESESYVDIHPTYPLGARLRGEEGVVIVRVTVNNAGRAEKVEVMKSSGFASLDESAVDAMKKARFVAKNGGVINGGQVTLPFRFRLVD
jgi:protein TonB